MPWDGPYVSGCVQVENTDKKFPERIMNPNGAGALGARVNWPSVHSFVLPTFYGNSIGNISIHAWMMAHGTTLSHLASLPLVSFPLYITHLPRRTFLSRMTRSLFRTPSPFTTLLREGIWKQANDRGTNQGSTRSIICEILSSGVSWNTVRGNAKEKHSYFFFYFLLKICSKFTV